MKKSIIIKMAALAAATALSQGVLAADGTINFTGDIVDSSCAVKGSSQNMTVALGNVVRSSFDGATSGTAVIGKKATPTPFTIDLTGCGASVKGAVLTFTGTTDSTNSTALRVANAGLVGTTAAQGVAIELSDSTGTKINIGSATSAYLLGVGDNNLNFQAAYVATNATIVPGPANAVAQFTIAYR